MESSDSLECLLEDEKDISSPSTTIRIKDLFSADLTLMSVLMTKSILTFDEFQYVPGRAFFDPSSLDLLLNWRLKWYWGRMLMVLNMLFFTCSTQDFGIRPQLASRQEMFFHGVHPKFLGHSLMPLPKRESFNKVIGGEYDIVSGSSDSSLNNALWVAQALLHLPKTADKRILLLTNEDGPFGSIKGITKPDMTRTTLQRAKDARDLGIAIELLPLSRTNEEFKSEN